MSLGRRDALARQHYAWTPIQLAEPIGVNFRTVRNMEAGAPGTALVYLARALHVFGKSNVLQTAL